jgi:AcrR family transcriptional regulator
MRFYVPLDKDRGRGGDAIEHTFLRRPRTNRDGAAGGVQSLIGGRADVVSGSVAELDIDRIARAGLAVADDRGASGFTMRAVAEVLGVTPMALYHHVASKDDLISLIVDAAVGEVPVPEPTGSWRDDLFELTRWMRRIARAHPAVGQLRKGVQVFTPVVLPVTERWFSLWRDSGLEPSQAILAASASSMAVVGVAEQEAKFASMQLPPHAAVADLPNVRAAIEQHADPDVLFELAVRALIDGIHARLSVSTTASAV